MKVPEDHPSADEKSTVQLWTIFLSFLFVNGIVVIYGPEYTSLKIQEGKSQNLNRATTGFQSSHGVVSNEASIHSGKLKNFSVNIFFKRDACNRKILIMAGIHCFSFPDHLASHHLHQETIFLKLKCPFFLPQKSNNDSLRLQYPRLSSTQQ